MDLAQILGTFGAPPLALMVTALLFERNRLLDVVKSKEEELKANLAVSQARLDKMADKLLELAENMSDSNTP